MARNKGVTLPAPGSHEAPKYWQFEPSGELTSAMWRYLRNEPLTDKDMTLIRAYLWQWIDSAVWDRNPNRNASTIVRLGELRGAVGGLTTREAIEQWVRRAADEGMDPL
jgi:hypothetical protein